MNEATQKLRDSKVILDAIIEALRDVELTGDDTPAAPAFERVEFFDLVDWQDAMMKLAMNQQRSAILTWSGEDWEHQRETVVLTSRRSQSYELMISERRLDAPVAALTGDERSPGVVGLKDLVVAALTGVLIEGDDDSETIYLTVQTVQRGVLSVDDKKKEPGRQVLILSLQAQGEWLQTAVDQNPSY